MSNKFAKIAMQMLKMKNFSNNIKIHFYEYQIISSEKKLIETSTVELLSIISSISKNLVNSTYILLTDSMCYIPYNIEIDLNSIIEFNSKFYKVIAIDLLGLLNNEPTVKRIILRKI